MRKLSIKLRITLWFTLVMVAMVSVVLAFVVALGERSVRLHARDIMTQIVTERFDGVEYRNGELEKGAEEANLVRGVYLSVYDDSKQYRGGQIPPGFDLYGLPLLSGLFRTVKGGQESWFVYDEERLVAQGRYAWVRGVLSVSGEMNAFSVIIRLALVILPVIVLLAAVIGYILVARAFRPVRLLTESAEKIVDGSDLTVTRQVHIGEGKDEIHRLAETFDSMLSRLHASFERERQFTSDVSHELRTPTAVMISQCEFALENAKSLEEAQGALSSILAQAERMSALTSQLLSLSRMGPGREQISRERINLSELAELVAAQMEEGAAEKHIAIHTRIEPDLMVEGDETLLMRLLLNLMENGIRYGKPDGSVTLTLRRQGDTVVGSVSDNGIGIAPDHLERIWDRLYQVDAARSSGGIGLGLSMVRHIVTSHGGSVAVESKLGEGSVFSFTLPAL